jgi:putative SOS response-associated peptidase YedK
MCGRYVIAKSALELAEEFDAQLPIDFETISYNIAPTHRVPILVERELEGELTRELHPARFGLIPSWAKDPGQPLFNARVETVLEKPSFSESALRKRCMIPASGYYEWDADKNPLFIHSENLVLFAGIYSFWRDPQARADDPARWVLSCSILTTASVGPLSEIHDRSPLFLTEDSFDAWIDPDYQTTNELLQALVAESSEVAHSLTRHQVSKEVGKVAVNHPELISPVSF